MGLLLYSAAMKQSNRGPQVQPAKADLINAISTLLRWLRGVLWRRVLSLALAGRCCALSDSTLYNYATM
jgi:hypothetical protein